MVALWSIAVTFKCEGTSTPTCTGSLVLNQQVLLFLTSGLLQLTLVVVLFAIGATNLQKRVTENDVRFISLDF